MDQMPSFNIPSSTKRNYSRIPLKTKSALIKLIFRKSVSFDDAISQLGLKKTTAINIINRYRETGSFPVRKYRRTSKRTKGQQDSKIQHPIVKREQENSKQSNDEPSQQGINHQQQSSSNPSSIVWLYYPMIYYPAY